MVQLLNLLPRKRIFHSKINGKITLLEFFGKKSLFVGGATQSGGFTQKMWETAIEKVKSQSSHGGTEVKNTLILGVGGGTLIRILKKYFPQTVITGVEIDPVMITIARKYFFKKRDLPAKIILADAIVWVKKQTKSHIFDLIAVDLYVGRLNPKQIRSSSFLLKLRDLLQKGGVILYNSHYQSNNPKEYERFRTRCKKIFASFEEVLKYPLSRLVWLE